ncbi:hypothetical protein K438DRAFT_2070463 [Mycena galopus ATCC 62051]|nr:hypothetical protein K438DRAFT_2070463 [Mycena galopus ATCC 62051]
MKSCETSEMGQSREIKCTGMNPRPRQCTDSWTPSGEITICWGESRILFGFSPVAFLIALVLVIESEVRIDVSNVDPEEGRIPVGYIGAQNRSQEEIGKREQAFIKVIPGKFLEIREQKAIRSLLLNGFKDLGQEKPIILQAFMRLHPMRILFDVGPNPTLRLAEWVAKGLQFTTGRPPISDKRDKNPGGAPDIRHAMHQIHDCILFPSECVQRRIMKDIASAREGIQAGGSLSKNGIERQILQLRTLRSKCLNYPILVSCMQIRWYPPAGDGSVAFKGKERGEARATHMISTNRFFDADNDGELGPRVKGLSRRVVNFAMEEESKQRFAFTITERKQKKVAGSGVEYYKVRAIRGWGYRGRRPRMQTRAGAGYPVDFGRGILLECVVQGIQKVEGTCMSTGAITFKGESRELRRRSSYALEGGVKSRVVGGLQVSANETLPSPRPRRHRRLLPIARLQFSLDLSERVAPKVMRARAQRRERLTSVVRGTRKDCAAPLLTRSPHSLPLLLASSTPAPRAAVSRAKLVLDAAAARTEMITYRDIAVHRAQIMCACPYPPTYVWPGVLERIHCAHVYARRAAREPRVLRSARGFGSAGMREEMRRDGDERAAGRDNGEKELRIAPPRSRRTGKPMGSIEDGNEAVSADIERTPAAPPATFRTEHGYMSPGSRSACVAVIRDCWLRTIPARESWIRLLRANWPHSRAPDRAPAIPHSTLDYTSERGRSARFHRDGADAGTVIETRGQHGGGGVAVAAGVDLDALDVIRCQSQGYQRNEQERGDTGYVAISDKTDGWDGRKEKGKMQLDSPSARSDCFLLVGRGLVAVARIDEYTSKKGLQNSLIAVESKEERLSLAGPASKTTVFFFGLLLAPVPGYKDPTRITNTMDLPPHQGQTIWLSSNLGDSATFQLYRNSQGINQRHDISYSVTKLEAGDWRWPGRQAGRSWARAQMATHRAPMTRYCGSVETYRVDAGGGVGHSVSPNPTVPPYVSLCFKLSGQSRNDRRSGLSLVPRIGILPLELIRRMEHLLDVAN